MAQQVYATEDDLSVPQKALADMDPADVTRALADSSSDADGYIRKRFNLPLTSWTRSLTQAVADMATWRLMKKRGFNPDSESSKQIMGAYRDALDWLEKVAENKTDPAFVDATGVGQDETNAAADTLTEKPFVVYATRRNGWDPNGNCGSGGGFWG